MYRMAPLANRRIFFRTVSILIMAGAYFVIFGPLWPILALWICGIALVPINFAVRAYAVKRMIAEYAAI